MTLNEAKKYTLEIGRKIFEDKFRDETSEELLNQEKNDYHLSFGIIGCDFIRISLSMSAKESYVLVHGPELDYDKLTKKTIKQALFDTKVYLDNLTEFDFYDDQEKWKGGHGTITLKGELNETEVNNWFYDKKNYIHIGEKKPKIRYLKIRYGYDNYYKCYKKDENGHFHFYDVVKKVRKEVPPSHLKIEGYEDEFE